MSKCLTGISLLATMMAAQAAALRADELEPDKLTIVISPDRQLTESPSIVEYTGQQLDAAGVDNTQELQLTTPGMVFKSSAGGGDLYLRGVGGNVSAVGDAGIATVVDGVTTVQAVQSLQAFYDIDRVAVMKGPDAAWSGRSVLGGAIRIETQDPEFFRDGFADMQYGTYDRRQLRGAINLPLPGTGLAVRVAGTLNRRDGYSRNIFRHEDLDDEDYYALRGKLRYRPSSHFDMVLSAEQSHQDDSRDLGKYPDPDASVNGGILLGGIVPDNPRKVTANVAQRQDVKNSLYIARMDWQQSGVTAQSITALQKTNQRYSADLDSTNIDFASVFPETESRALSQEFRVASLPGTIGWSGGVYFQKAELSDFQDLHLPLVSVQNTADSDTTKHAYAVFGELTWRFASKWRSRAALRYSYDQGEQALVQSIADPAGVSGTPGIAVTRSRQKDHWDALTPALGISYAPGANLRFYADVSRGYKPGGYNTFSIQPSYDPETLWAYEAGIDAAWPGKDLRIKSALFYYDYQDIQLLTLPPNAPPGTLPIIDNAPQATVQGLEIQVWHRPLRQLSILVSATLMKARYDDFVSIDPNNPGTDPDRSGDHMQQAPDVSLVLGGEYKWLLRKRSELKLSADYRYQSAVYFNPYQDRAGRQGAYSLVNARLGFQGPGGHWYAELYGNNLTDKLYAQNIVRIDPVVGTAHYWGEPRTYGVRVGCRL